MRKSGVLALLFLVALSADGFGWFNMSLDEPISKLADNSAVDIVYDGTYIWLATGNGLSGTSDRGITWRTFNEETGFTHSSISALTTDGLHLWAATAYEIPVEDDVPVAAGGGFQMTNDFGSSFQHVAPEQASQAGMLCYDLAVQDSSVWAACFYGGLIRSLDYGQSWESVFIDDAAREDYETGAFDLLRSRYFSVLVDPYHDDSVIVWAGSAEGVQRIYYIDKSKKLASNRINDISFDGTFWWYATDNGLSRLDDTLFSLFTDTVVTTYTFLTYDSSDGFPGNYVTTVGAEGDLICAGIHDVDLDSSLGLVISSDGGANWFTKEPTQVMGAGRMAEEIEVQDGYIWVGCGRGGLIRSDDQGGSWRNFYLDSTRTETTDLRNVFHGFDVSPRDGYTKVLAGTDSGLVNFYFTDPEQLDSTDYVEAYDNPSHGQKFVSVASSVEDDNERIWAAAYPRQSESDAPYAVVQKVPGYDLWDAYLNESPGIVPYDVAVLEFQSTVSVWVAHDKGLYVTSDSGETWQTPDLVDIISRYPQVIVIDDDEPFLSVESGGSDLHVGSRNAGALEVVAPITRWFSFAAQTDPLQFDFVGRSYRSGGLYDTLSTTIGGNWIIAMGLQRTGDSTIVWASTKPVYTTGHTGVSISADRGRTWQEVAEGMEVWNFEFNGDSAFLAAEQGLYISTDFGVNWSKYAINDFETGRSIAPDVPVYSAQMISGELWIGSEDGIARSADGINWEIFRYFNEIDPGVGEDERSYVSPNPFSPYVSSGPMKFHYYLEKGGEVTIKIFDFANNLVKIVTDRATRAAGIQHDDLDFWDGTNERGDKVAGGVYIYVIESTGGDELWGKLMVLP